MGNNNTCRKYNKGNSASMKSERGFLGVLDI